MGARRKARKRALDFLYEADIRGLTATEIYEPRGESDLSQEQYVKEILAGVAEHSSRIEELISTYAEGWETDRMPALDRNILRVAIFEILWSPDVDEKIAASEAVNLAQELSTENSASYINGILGRLIVLKPSLAI